MKLKQIKINNYRSLGEDACLNFNSNVMALVGLNGIGKSNVLEAISRMKFFENGCESVIPPNAINQNTRLLPHLLLEVEFSKEERCTLGKKFGCTISSTHVEYIFEFQSGRTRLKFDGAFTEAIENNSTLVGIQKELQGILDTTKKNANYQGHWEYEAFSNAVTGYSHYYVPRLKEALAWVHNNVINPFFPEPRRGAAIHVLEKLLSNLDEAYSKFRMFSPRIFLFQDAAEFPTEYDSNAIASWDRHLDDNHKIALNRFWGLLELLAMNSLPHSRRRISVANRVFGTKSNAWPESCWKSSIVRSCKTKPKLI